MAVLYRIYQNNNESSKTYGKWYARSVMLDTLKTDEVADLIQQNCTVKKSDVVAVLKELVDIMQEYLGRSYAVKLDGLGTFKIGLKTQAADSVAEFAPSSNIVGSRINFLPETYQVTSGNKKTRVRTLQSKGFSVKETPKNDVSTEESEG